MASSRGLVDNNILEDTDSDDTLMLSVCTCTQANIIVVYSTMPYVGMALNKMEYTLKVQNDTLEMSVLD